MVSPRLLFIDQEWHDIFSGSKMSFFKIHTNILDLLTGGEARLIFVYNFYSTTLYHSMIRERERERERERDDVCLT